MMTQDKEVLMREAQAAMMADLLDDVGDRLAGLAELIADLRSGHLSDEEAYRAFARSLHSLKGLASAFGLKPLADLCHAFEDRLPNDPGLRQAQTLVAALQAAQRDDTLADPAVIAAIRARVLA